MKEVKEDMQDYKKEIVSDDSQNEKPTCSKFERVLERYIDLKSADNFSSPSSGTSPLFQSPAPTCSCA